MSGMVTIEEFRPVLKNTLRGFASVAFPSGMIVEEVSLHVSEGRAWASAPARPMLNATGTAMLDEHGKPRWKPFIRFRDRATRDTWSDLVIAAVRQTYPEALA
jgi:hypothetical protein